MNNFLQFFKRLICAHDWRYENKDGLPVNFDTSTRYAVNPKIYCVKCGKKERLK